jgi:hypothetical protein
MKARLLLLTFLIGCWAPPLLAQSPGSDGDIVFARDLERQTRAQLRAVLSAHDVSPWMHKRRVKVDAASVGQSGPYMITLSTQHIGDSLGLLAEFIHEQIHRITYEERLRRRNAAIEAFRSMYPDAPAEKPEGGPSKFVSYMHLVINWLELDAMTQLVGEETARRLAAEEKHYTWINERILEDTQKIGAVLARHDLLITPEKGLVVETEPENAEQ